MQAKLLRALQEHEIRPVGATDRVRVDVRIIAATNRDLESMLGTGSFRQDLYFRLNIVQITVPPLRERTSDIPLLVQAFVTKYREPESQMDVSDAAMKYLQAYHWPGNVRELENAVMRGLALSAGPLVEPQHFDLHGESIGQPKRACELRSMKELKNSAVVCALRETGGDKAEAARLLGIGKTTLYRKLKVKSAVAS
jgi:two-component system response regulator HydG